MKKKKVAICHAQVPFFYGGGELHAESLKNELLKRNYHADIVTLPYKWYPNEQLVQSMLNWRLIDLSESNGEKIDLVIPMKFPSYGVQHHNKVIWLMHQFRQVYDLFGTQYSEFDHTPESLSTRELVKRFDNNSLNESKKLFTTSNNNANRLKKYNNIGAEVLYHPPKHYGKYFTETYGDYILSVGRLDKLKRIDLLINAIKYTDNNVKCIIAGSGPEKENLEKLIHKLGLEHRIKLVGFIDDAELLHYLANCLGVYYAPYDEDYGYVTLEAFLSKKPIISFEDSGGVLEFVQDNENGFILSQHEQISETINYLYHNKNKAISFGEIGHNLVKDISWDYVIDRLTETIR
ncbi:glycosyltransferase family 4 protein [Paenibacillus sp. UNC451MF]|uniref:glycosyltransferase family 4 protein n=1 Tax=Paenibacillus sp. UNC451MF TaxID=1449063 RepID=UPI00048D1D10|nr:glycosyltransferase family 4 protein [Paenibacillus sp. UNC451MF]